MPPALSNDSFSQTYTQYLMQVQAVSRLPRFPKLDAVENRMLGILASRWHEGKPITVLEAMVMLPEISTNTAHRRLTILRKKGMIDPVLNEEDRRIKYIVPTKATHRYFAQLGQCMGGSKTELADCARRYIKYLHLTQEVRSQPIFQRMDTNDIAMLDTWAVAWHNGTPMGVLKALSLINNRAPSKSHGRMHGLRAIGLIDLVPDQDRRIKYVLPTQATHHYFSQLGKCMHQALSS